ncbi:hypothetical protein CR513_10540, partial [Mucuna pruriens]
MPAQGNSSSLKDLMKQLTANNLEFQQFQHAILAKHNCHHPRPQTQIGQLADTVSHLHSAKSSNLPSQTIPNPRGNVSAVTLRSGKELSQPALQQLLRSAEADSKPDANSQSRQDKTVLVSYPTRTIATAKSESDEEFLKMF